MPALTFGFTAQQIVDEDRVKWEDINLLQAWTKKQNLPPLTDEQVVLFLLSCFNEQEPTRATIKAHYRIKNRCPEIFDDRSTKRADVQKQLNTVEACILAERTDDGCLVALMRLHDTYYGNLEQGPLMKVLYMSIDAALQEHPPTGLVVVIDMKGVGIMHLTRLRLGMLKAFFDYLQEGLPAKLRKIHVFNTVYFIDKLMFIVKPFLKKEVYDMVTFHQPNMDMAPFYENWLPKKCLPEDYGGDLPSLTVLHQRNVEKIANLESHFEEEELQRHSVN